MKALVLSAGEGTRMRPFTLDRPKPMLKVGGRPILEHLVALLRHHGIAEIALNVHYRPESIVEHFGDGSRFGVSITYSPEPELLGTAGAAKRLEWFLTETFVLMYGDVLTDLDLTDLIDHHRRRGALATLALYEVPDPSRCGIVELASDGRIVRFVEKPAPDAVFSNLASAGICVLEPEVLALVPPHQPFDFGHGVFPALIDRGLPIFGRGCPAYILDIGSAERYAQAEADLRSGRLRHFCSGERRAS